MAKVLKADASVADAYVEFALTPAPDDVWLTFGFATVTAAVAAFDDSMADGRFFLAQTDDWSDAVLTDPAGGPATFATGFIFGGPLIVADTWVTVEFHLNVTTGDSDLYVDGVLVGSNAAGGGFYGPTDVVRFGLRAVDSGWAPGVFAYFDNVKVGTTRGDDDLFGDDFESGDLSAWTTESGSVSVIDDPLTLVWTHIASPELVVSTAHDLAAATFTEQRRFPVTDGRRGVFDAMKDHAQAVSVRVVQDGASATTELYGVELDVEPREPTESAGD